MLTLKEYQQRALDTLRTYFAACSGFGNPDTAFYETTREVHGAGVKYVPVEGLPGLPYVCIRIPTGGGKTIVAAHAAAMATRELLKADRSVILWLTPSNAILTQTIAALRDKAHPYRQALDAALQEVTILDIREALFMRPALCDGSTVVIVATMQAFRVEDTEGRKVYEESGALEPHFNNVPDWLRPMLECYPGGDPIPSLVNVFCLRRPVVIVDEAHNARTNLSFETLARFRPACILEFTATPALEGRPSNVLHSVSAAELNAEEMIKLPIRLEVLQDWKKLLADAIATRVDLENAARQERAQTGENIRPIMLIQAQPHLKGKDTITVEVVKTCLLNDHRIPADQIAVATGDERGLDGVDVNAIDCPIRFVITVQALKEGWDCPFAYVLCSVAELRSSTAIEQILGRIMRLPKASRKKDPKLNQAYAFSASKSFVEAAQVLKDSLVENGFQKLEVDHLVAPIQHSFNEEPSVFMGATTATVTQKPDLASLPKDVAAKVVFNSQTNELTFQGEMAEPDKEALVKCFTSGEAKAVVEAMYQKSRGMPTVKPGAPPERGETFAVPLLIIRQGNLFEPFEETHFLNHPWKLSECDAALSEAEFSATPPAADHGEITVTESGELKISRYVNQVQRQLSLIGTDVPWEPEHLAVWLDRHIPHPDIGQSESVAYLMRLIDHLIRDRKIPIETLVRDKYRLKEAATAKIQRLRLHARTQAYQALLLPSAATPLGVDPNVCFTFKPDQYPYNTFYRGSCEFKRHFYPKVGDLDSKGEEFECAAFIDALPEVKHWVRNLERRQNFSFWLQTSSDRFYPDFVCALTDGRFLVVEYKGADRWTNEDSMEKRAIGQLWEDRSAGQCLFVMPKGKDFAAIRAKVLTNNTGNSRGLG